MRMTNTDYSLGLLAGFASALLWAPVLRRLALLPGPSILIFIFGLPLLFLLGIFLAERLFPSKAVMHKIAKFLTIGILNAGIDFAIFNLLIYLSKAEIGFAIVTFKSTSFALAMTNSYAWNRFWTFGNEAAAERKGREFFKFVAVTVGGFLLNVGATSLIINLVRAPLGLTQIRWDNAAAVIATALNLVWNFAGYHLLVFSEERPIKETTPAPEHAQL